MTSLARRAWKWLAGIFAGIAIVLALLVGAFRIAVTQTPDYRQPIADWASGLLGLPVDIERLDARFGLGGPELVFAQATVFSADRSEALFSASEATLSLDVSELLFGWRLAADAFTLNGLTLEVDRAETGELLVFDRTLKDLPRSTGPALVRELRIRDATVVLRDGMAGGRDWVLKDVEALLSRRGAQTRIDGRFKPPTDLGSEVTFWATNDRPGGWKSYASLKEMRLAALSQIPTMPSVLPTRGDGDIRLWVDTEAGMISRVSAEVQLRNLTVEFGDGEGGEYAQLDGRVEWDRLTSGWRTRVEDLQVRRAGSQWSSSRLMVEKRVVEGRQVGDLFVDGDFLRLDDLRPFVPLIPDEGLRESLAAMQPSGDVSALTAHLTVVDKEAPGYQVEASAEIAGINLKSYGKLPGIRGLSGRIRSDPKGGRIELDSRSLSVTFSDLFRDALQFDTARGLVVWSRGADGLTVIGDGLEAENRDLGLQAGFRLRLPGSGEPGRIDVQATAVDVDLASTSRYLPVGIMSSAVVRWLDSAIVSGRVPTARLELGGPTKGFPYPGGEGVFEVNFGARDLVLDYAQNWPLASGISADMLFRGPGLFADIRDGRLGDAAVDSVRVAIPVLREGMLSIEGKAAGPLEAVRGYVLNSPLEKTIGGSLAETRIEAGNAVITVDILLPLKNLAERDVRVDLDIQDARVLYGRIPHPLESASGRLTIQNNEVHAQDISGVFLDRTAVIDIAPYDGGGTRAYIESTITDKALVEVLDIPLGNYLQGEAPWTGFAHFPAAGSGDRFWIHLDSEIQEIALELPYPVAKPAGEALPLSIDFEFPEAGFTEWSATYGERLSAQVRFATADEGLRLVAADILLGATGARIGDEPGLVIEGRVDRLPALEWLGVRFGDRGEGELRDILTRIDLTAQDAGFGGQHFDNVSARLEQDGGWWRLRLDSDALSGSVSIPMVLSTGTPLVLDMDRLHLDNADEDGGEDSIDPRNVPSMEISAKDFRLEGLRLGRLEAEIRSVPNGFRLKTYKITGPNHTIEGEGRSLLGFGQDVSTLTLSAATSDMGATMEYIGFERSVEAKSATFTADLRWSGGLPASVLAVADGTARLDIKSGSLSEVKPGAGRMFGLLSVQALPRRLTLDFRDVFKKGFFFDEFGGDFKIANGKAYTDNLVFRSPAADIGIVGDVNLTDRLYDQTAIVSAEVGNTLPVVGAIAAGPAIGAGLFVLKEIFKEPLRGMINVQYKITGPWENPEVVRVAAAEGGTGPAEPEPSPKAPPSVVEGG